jgi:hypothetical protein
MEREPINLSDALNRISEIHEHLAKGELYRGYRSLPVAASGICGIIAALLQPPFSGPGGSAAYLRYWIVAAVACAAVASSEIAWNFAFRSDRAAQRCTCRVVGQIIPSLLAGIAVTIALGRDAELVPLLPGLWAVIFSLGVFATRPYAPRASGWVGLYFLCAGAWLLVSPGDAGPVPEGWRVGGVFGVGHLAAALVLYWNLERKNGTEEDT